MSELRFSEGRAIQFLFEHHINKPKEKGMDCIYNFLRYAEEKGWLNVDKIQKDLTPFRIIKVIAWNNTKHEKENQNETKTKLTHNE